MVGTIVITSYPNIKVSRATSLPSSSYIIDVLKEKDSKPRDPDPNTTEFGKKERRMLISFAVSIRLG